MKNFMWGKWLIATVALATIILPFVADYNKTHIFNPNWSGHAIYHNAQAITMGAISGLMALWAILIKRGDALTRIQFAALLSTIYWLGQIGAAFFPGIAYFDANSTEKAPVIFGIEIVQPYLATLFVLIVLGGYLLERRRLANQT
jgi:hypothetical protein